MGKEGGKDSKLCKTLFCVVQSQILVIQQNFKN